MGVAVMSDDIVDVVPEPVVHAPNPLFEALVERRSTRLCIAAEPHADAAPCVAHVMEARRQLFEQWLVQQRAEVA